MKNLVQQANQAGGEDNITVVAVAFSGEPGMSEADADTDAALKIGRFEEAKTLVPDEEPEGRPADEPTWLTINTERGRNEWVSCHYPYSGRYA